MATVLLWRGGQRSAFPCAAHAAILHVPFVSRMRDSNPFIHSEATGKAFWPNSLPCVMEKGAKLAQLVKFREPEDVGWSSKETQIEQYLF